MDDNWLDVVEPWPRQRPCHSWAKPNAERFLKETCHSWKKHPTKKRVARPTHYQKIHALQDDRAETYCNYSCSTCDQDNGCCRCPDPRPQTHVPSMYVIDMRDRTVRPLTYYETISTLGQKNHDTWMEQYIGRSFWKGLIVDYNAWHPGPPDPLHVHYAKPKFRIFDDDDF